MKRWLASILVTAGSVGGLCGCRSESDKTVGPASASRPNIILMTVESLRADHIGCYGYGRDTTPALDALSAEGILYENAYSVTSWTLASHASIFTGLYPAAHRVTRPQSRLHRSYATLAELLAGAGYQTAGFVSGPFLRRPHNLHQGFEIYDDAIANPKGNDAAHEDVTSGQMEANLREFLTQQRDADRPFFLFAYWWDPHYDYIPPAPYDETFVPDDAERIDVRGYESKNVVTKEASPGQLAYVISQYDGEILWTDTHLGRLWALLRELGLWEETAILVTADHAEEFFEHGTKGHKNNLYAESIHVPLIFKPPHEQEARRDDRVVNLIDLFPTVLDLAGVEPDGPFQGHSLLGPGREADDAVFFELETSWYFQDAVTGEQASKSDAWYAVREGSFKLVGIRNQSVWELYDVSQDPGERHPLRDEGHRATRDRLRKKIDAYITAMTKLASAWGQATEAPLSEKDLERLESLGYIRRSR